jgi:hypothetical protein
VVAGAREMMRYRRNRASTLEGTQQTQPSSAAAMPSATYGAASGSTPWAVYQGGAKPVGGQVPIQGGSNVNTSTAAQSAQQAAMRKVRMLWSHRNSLKCTGF